MRIPVFRKAAPNLLQPMLDGELTGYPSPIQQLEKVKETLPKGGVVALILDAEIGKSVNIDTLYQELQNYFCPLRFDTKPTAPVGLIACSTEHNAEMRLRQTGYKWAVKLSNAVGIVEKVSQ